jgi:hypothetical protein
MMFNVSETIMMEQPDSDGHKIPPGTLHGTAVLSAASPDPVRVNVGVSIGIFNVSTATCGGHCPYCTSFTDFRVQADRGTAPVGQDTQFSSWGLRSSGGWVDYTLQSSWTSSNIQVAQPSGSTVGAFTGVSPGQFSGQAVAQLQVNYCPDSCTPDTYVGEAPGTITPRIDSVSPAQGAAGAITSVTINGQGFGTSASINAGANISASVTSINNTQIHANFTVSGSASGGNQSVSVTASGHTSNSLTFYVQTPTSLSIVVGTDSTTSEAQCTFTSGGQQYTGCGLSRSFTYQVKDQAGNPIQSAGLQVWDSFGTVSPNPLGIGGFLTTCTPANTGPCGVTTNGAGQFAERQLSVCSTVCRSNGVCVTAGPSIVNQTWHVGTGSLTQNISYYCQRVLVNGN